MIADKSRFWGQTGAFDGDDAVRIVLDQPAAPQFIVRKLIRYFVFDEPEPPASLVEPLAKKFRDDDFAIGPLIERIFNSQLFYSQYAIARKIRSPIELGIGLLRALQGTTNVYRLSKAGRAAARGSIHQRCWAERTWCGGLCAMSKAASPAAVWQSLSKGRGAERLRRWSTACSNCWSRCRFP
jgi:uncharacterized protein (DUF1800 family)